MDRMRKRLLLDTAGHPGGSSRQPGQMHQHHSKAAVGAVERVSRKTKRILTAMNQTLGCGRRTDETGLFGEREVANTAISGAAIRNREVPRLHVKPPHQPFPASSATSSGADSDDIL